jgi:DNA-binding CsgD family transcriptional regulator
MSSYPPITFPATTSSVAGAHLGVTSHPRSSASDSRYAELLAALTLQIARERPHEAIALIDGLLRNGRERKPGQFSADLRALRAVAELEVDRLDALANRTRRAPGQHDNSIVTIIDFLNRIMPAIELVALNGSNPILSDQLASELLGAAHPGRGKSGGTVHHLSEREFQVLQLVSIGLSNQEVGIQLCISEGTVKKHLSNVLDKLDAGNRTQAVARARALGIL